MGQGKEGHRGRGGGRGARPPYEREFSTKHIKFKNSLLAPNIQIINFLDVPTYIHTNACFCI